MKALSLRSLSPAVLGLLTALAACGGAPEAKAPPAQAPAREDMAEPTSVEEAQEQIARARDRLASVPAGGSQVESAPERDESSTTRPRAEPPPPASTPGARKSGVHGGDGHCANPCRALASMRRAVTALCRMTGDADSRCQDARRTLAASEGSVIPCSC